MKPKIYLWCVPASGWGHGDVVAYALAEDGTGVGSHLSSGVSWAKHDIGLTSTWHHETYREHYPDGYEVQWIDDPENSPELKAALELNRQQAEAAEKNQEVPK